MAVRKEPLLEFHCKQMDHFVGLNFSNNFHFALMVHLVKGNNNLPPARDNCYLLNEADYDVKNYRGLRRITAPVLNSSHYTKAAEF